MKDPKLNGKYRDAVWIIKELSESAEQTIHLLGTSQMSKPQKNLKAKIERAKQFLKNDS